MYRDQFGEFVHVYWGLRVKEGLSKIIIIFNILAVKSVTGFCTFYNSTRYFRTNQVPHLT